MKQGMNKGQLQISFGMIFSIFLIIVFIFVAFIAIKAFLDIQGKIETGFFLRDLQNDATRIYNGVGGEEQTYTYTMKNSEKITHVCFYDMTKPIKGNWKEIGQELKKWGGDVKNNLYFYPPKLAKVSATEIKYIDMEKFDDNPYCIEKQGEKANIRLSKRVDETLITVS